MRYSLEGKLRGWLCEECWEPLASVRVRVYGAAIREEIATYAAAAEGDAENQRLTAAAVKEKQSRLLGEAGTTADGSFRVDIGETTQYDGGPVEVDVFCTTVPGLREPRPEQEPVQFTAAVLQPQWERGEISRAAWEYTIPFRLWCWIRGHFDAWVICGRLVTCKAGIPIANATVRGYDADWLQDDALGMAVTDAAGRFRIHYTSAQFRKTPFSPLLNVELTEGPDLYFKVWHGGNLVLEEHQDVGRRRGRENVRHCYCVRLCTDRVKVLACELTGPSGCVHGTRGLLPAEPDRALEAITGTAHGTDFDRYEIEVLWNGTLAITGAIVYADAAGNPDTSLASGDHPVSGGTLAFLDLNQAMLGAGNNILTNTDYLLRMRVFGTGGGVQPCTRMVSVASSTVYIKTVGGAVADDTVPASEPLRFGTREATVGGSVTVRGAANVYGCMHEKIAQYRIWVSRDDTFALPQPGNGTAFAGGPGWTAVTSVDFTTPVTIGTHTFLPDELRARNPLTGEPNPDNLTRGAWTTRDVPVTFDAILTTTVTVPDLSDGAWNTVGTSGTGKYSVLLQVVDTAGNTYYDIQRVWVDNEVIQVTLTGLGGLPACTDLYTREFNSPPDAFRTINVDGTAWDALIDPADATAQPTNDNFSGYVVEFQKQGAAGWVTLPAAVADASPASSTTPSEVATLTGSVPVPARPSPVGVGTLARWDLQSLDAATNPFKLRADQLLAAHEACTYLVRLRASDLTWVNESGTHSDDDFFPVKIINDPAPTP